MSETTPPPLTAAELAQLERLCAEATPGPWFIPDADDPASDGWPLCWMDDYTVCHGHGEGKPPPTGQTLTDLQLIAASRAAVPALLAEVQRLRDPRVQGIISALQAGDLYGSEAREGGIPPEFMRLWRTVLDLAQTDDGKAIVRQLYWFDTELARLREAQRWRTVAQDGLPAAGERVLVRNGTRLMDASLSEANGRWLTDGLYRMVDRERDSWLPWPQGAPSPSGPVDLYRCGACDASTWFTSPPCSPLEYPCQACNTLVRGSDWKLIPVPEPTP